MFGRFDIVGIYLGKDPTPLLMANGRPIWKARIFTERPESSKSNYRYTLGVNVRKQKAIDILEVSQRGDLVHVFGEIVAKTMKNGGIWIILDVAYWDRLISGFNYHVTGRCKIDAPPSKYDPVAPDQKYGRGEHP